MHTTALRSLAAVGTVALALTLSACGASIEDQIRAASTPTVPELPSTASSSSQGTSSPSSTAASSSGAGAATNDRGNIEVAVGDEGVLESEDGTALLTFAIDGITPDVPCTEEYADPAENGHLTAVQMRVSTNAVSPDDLSYLAVSSYDFSFIGADGITVSTVDSFATYSCLADSTLFPSDSLRPASQYAGIVLLDLPATSGTLIWSPTTFSSNSAGWEITY